MMQDGPVNDRKSAPTRRPRGAEAMTGLSARHGSQDERTIGALIEPPDDRFNVT